MPDHQDVKIAVLEREIAGLREQHKEHKEEITRTLKEFGAAFGDSMREIRGDIKNIYQFINQSKGSLATVILLASAMGGIIVAVLSWALTRWVH